MVGVEVTDRVAALRLVGVLVFPFDRLNEARVDEREEGSSTTGTPERRADIGTEAGAESETGTGVEETRA
jgi:hypothetical protein